MLYVPFCPYESKQLNEQSYYADLIVIKLFQVQNNFDENKVHIMQANFETALQINNAVFLLFNIGRDSAIYREQGDGCFTDSKLKLYVT